MAGSGLNRMFTIFNETLAFDLGLLFGGGKFTEITVGNTTQGDFDLDAQSTRFNLGVAGWP